MRWFKPAVLATAGVFILSGSAAGQPAPGFTELVSVSTDGVQGDSDSQTSSISADGRFVAFVSFADNLVPEDTNEVADVFVRDRLLGTTERVSVSSSGREGNDSSAPQGPFGGPGLSGDGRFVVFESNATNLVRGDRNASADVFVHDRLKGETTRVSVAGDGTEANAGGTDGSISRDGRFVSFVSFADNLVPDTNFTADVFVHDRQTGLTERISQTPDGADADGQSFAALLNADGRFVYFSSFASNLVAGDTDNDDVDVYLFDRQTQTMEAITSTFPSSDVLEHGVAGGISGDGRFLTFTTSDITFITPDTNGFFQDAWLVDRATGEYVLVGVNDAGEQGDDSTVAGDVSDDGRFVVLESRATNFGGSTGVLEDIFLRDRVAGTTRLVSVASDGTEADFPSFEPAMTPDGQVISFHSRSTTFVPENQTFFAFDVFVRDARPQADLSVTKTDSPDPVPERGELTYSASVANAGPAAATGATLVDTLPDAVFLSATPSQGTCVREGKGQRGGVLTCDLGAIAAGQAATVTIVVSPSRAGTLTNTAVVRANEPDADRADNTAAETTTVVPR